MSKRDSMDRTQIDAYIDGELSAEEKAAVDSAMRSDAGLRDEYLWKSKLKAFVRTKMVSQDNPDLWNKCVSRLDEVDRVEWTEWIVRKYRGALAGVVAVSILAAAYIHRTNPAAMAGDNLMRVMTASSAAFPSFSARNERQAVSWMNERLNKNVEVPPISNGYLRVLEVGIIDCGDCHVGRVVYTDGSSLYFLLAFPKHEEQPFEPVRGMPGVGWSRVGKLNAVSWHGRDSWMVFAGPADVSELLRMIR